MPQYTFIVVQIVTIITMIIICTNYVIIYFYSLSVNKVQTCLYCIDMSYVLSSAIIINNGMILVVQNPLIIQWQCHW